MPALMIVLSGVIEVVHLTLHKHARHIFKWDVGPEIADFNKTSKEFLLHKLTHVSAKLQVLSKMICTEGSLVAECQENHPIREKPP